MIVQEIINSKTYVNENNNITFGSPKDYLSPFIDIVGEDDLIVIGSDRMINKNEDGSENISYARVRIEKRFDAKTLNEIGDFNPIVGMIYALDVSKPVIKVYAGLNAVACNNLNVFNAEHLYQVELLSNYKTSYDYAKKFNNQINNILEEYFANIEQMKNRQLTNMEYKEIVGNVLAKSVKDNILGTTPIVKAVKLLEDRNSNYYFYKNDNNTLWNIYNSATDYISSSSEYKEHPNKSLKMFNILSESL